MLQIETWSSSANLPTMAQHKTRRGLEIQEAVPCGSNLKRQFIPGKKCVEGKAKENSKM